MIFINEWLPNPQGSDATGEWIEFFNSGPAPVSLKGWKITNGSGRGATLNFSIPAEGYAVLRRGQFSFPLRNTDETLELKDPQGRLEDQSFFWGEAPEGKSVNRATEGGYFASPTPGGQNNFSELQTLKSTNESGIIVQNLSPAQATFLALSLGLIFAMVILISVNRYEYFRKLLFEQN